MYESSAHYNPFSNPPCLIALEVMIGFRSTIHIYPQTQARFCPLGLRNRCTHCLTRTIYGPYALIPPMSSRDTSTGHQWRNIVIRRFLVRLDVCDRGGWAVRLSRFVAFLSEYLVCTFVLASLLLLLNRDGDLAHGRWNGKTADRPIPWHLAHDRWNGKSADRPISWHLICGQLVTVRVVWPNS